MNVPNNNNNNNNNSNKHYLTVNVFSSKVLTDDLVFTPPIGGRAAILRAHPSQAKVLPFAGQRQYLHFSVIFNKTLRIDPTLLGSHPRPFSLQLSALNLPRLLRRSGVLNGKTKHLVSQGKVKTPCDEHLNVFKEGHFFFFFLRLEILNKVD